MADVDFATRVAAAAEEMRRKAADREIRTETREELPIEMQERIARMEVRLASVETFRDALITEAARKMQGAA